MEELFNSANYITELSGLFERHARRTYGTLRMHSRYT